VSAVTEHWIELREFEHFEPSTLTFRAMVAFLDNWPTDDQTTAIEYAKKLLGNWPDAVRLARRSWCKAASKGAVKPTWQFARALQLATI
jgi:hypothetical protein